MSKVVNRKDIIIKLKALAAFVENDADIKKAGLGFDPEFLRHAANLLDKMVTPPEPMYMRTVLDRLMVMGMRNKEQYKDYIDHVIRDGKRALSRKIEESMEYQVEERPDLAETIVTVVYKGHGVN